MFIMGFVQTYLSLKLLTNSLQFTQVSILWPLALGKRKRLKKGLLRSDVLCILQLQRFSMALAVHCEVPAWEEYFKSNGFTDCQLVQTFVWRHKDQLVFACVPYPSRPDGALLAEAREWWYWYLCTYIIILSRKHQKAMCLWCPDSGARCLNSLLTNLFDANWKRCGSTSRDFGGSKQPTGRYKASPNVLCSYACPLHCQRLVCWSDFGSADGKIRCRVLPFDSWPCGSPDSFEWFSLAASPLKQSQQCVCFPFLYNLHPFALFFLPTWQGSLVVADEKLRGESRELLFDCGTVALFMSEAEFFRQGRENEWISSLCDSVVVSKISSQFGQGLWNHLRATFAKHSDPGAAWSPRRRATEMWWPGEMKDEVNQRHRHSRIASKSEGKPLDRRTLQRVYQLSWTKRSRFGGLLIWKVCLPQDWARQMRSPWRKRSKITASFSAFHFIVEALLGSEWLSGAARRTLAPAIILSIVPNGSLRQWPEDHFIVTLIHPALFADIALIKFAVARDHPDFGSSDIYSMIKSHPDLQ